MTRLVRKITLGLSVALCTLLLGAWVISNIFEEQVNAKVSAAINESMRAPFTSDSMELSMFRRFPNPSVHLENVVIKEALPEKVFADTLFYAEDLFLEIGLFDLIFGEFSIHELSASKVRLNPLITENGQTNYEVWHSDSTTTQTTIALEVIELTDLVLSYRNLEADFLLAAKADEIELSGLFNSEGTTFGIQGDLLFDSLKVGSERYVDGLSTTLDVTLQLPETDAILVIKDGTIKTNELTLQTDVLWSGSGAKEHMAVLLHGNEVDLEGAASLIPGLGPIFNRELWY